MIIGKPYAVAAATVDRGARLLLRRPRRQHVAGGDVIGLAERGIVHTWAIVLSAPMRPVSDLTENDRRLLGRAWDEPITATRLQIARALHVDLRKPILWIYFRPEPSS